MTYIHGSKLCKLVGNNTLNPGKKDVRRAPQKQKEEKKKKGHVQLELREGLNDDEEEGQEKKSRA